MIPENYTGRAILGEKWKNPDMIRRIDEAAKVINVILNPIDDPDRRKLNGVAFKLVENLAKPDEWKTDNVESLLAAERDNNRPENKKLAKDRLDFLVSATYVAIKQGDNEELKLALDSGSAKEIDDQLPKALCGMGEKIRNVEITNVKIQEILNRLDRSGRSLKEAGKGGEKAIKDNLENAIKELSVMEVFDDKTDEEVMKVSAYLGYEYEDMEMRGGEGVVKQERDILDLNTHKKTKRHPVDGEYFGSQEGPLGRTPVIEFPETAIEKINTIEDVESAKSWITKSFVEMSEKPIFFANWWQGDVVDSAVRMAAERLGYSSFSKEYGELKDYAYATYSVLGMQAVDKNADANSDNYGQFAPPKNMVSELHWDDGGEKYKLLKENPVVRGFLEEIYKTAYDKSDGWKIVKAFSDGQGYGKQNEFIKELIDEESGVLYKKFKDMGLDIENKEELLSKGRVALAMFEVDLVPEWIRYSHLKKFKYIQNPSVKDDPFPWLNIYKVPSDGNQVKRFTWSSRMSSVLPDGKECEIGYDHPRIARNFDVLVFKGSYVNRGDIVWGLEKVMNPLIEKHLMKDGRMVRASEKNILDKYLKFNKAMTEIFGGPQGAELDNLTNMEKTMMALKNYWGGFSDEKDKEVFTSFIVGLFKIKTDALFYPGYKSGADVVLNNIRSLDPYTGEKDRATALAGALGESGNFAHGWLAETNRIFGIDLTESSEVGGKLIGKYPDFWNAYMRLFMDTPDINEAMVKYKKAIRFLNERKFSAVSGGIGEAINILKK